MACAVALLPVGHHISSNSSKSSPATAARVSLCTRVWGSHIHSVATPAIPASSRCHHSREWWVGGSDSSPQQLAMPPRACIAAFTYYTCHMPTSVKQQRGQDPCAQNASAGADLIAVLLLHSYYAGGRIWYPDPEGYAGERHTAQHTYWHCWSRMVIDPL